MSKSLWLIDGNNILYRSYYAIGTLSTSSGQPTNAALGFTTTLLKLIKEKNPFYLAVAFDLKGPTFRHKLFPDYKIQRPPMPEDLVGQIPLIKEIIRAFRIPILEKQGYEADDVLATVAKRAEKENLNTFIITGDKDILQLVGEKIKVHNSNKNLLYDEEKVRENFGVSPENIVDLIALMGDASDNIPGVSGIGKKTAVKLIKEFGRIENLYENLDTPTIPPPSRGRVSELSIPPPSKNVELGSSLPPPLWGRMKEGGIIGNSLKEKLKRGKEMAFLSKKLAILDLAVPLKIKIADCQMSNPDYQKLKEIFARLEFRRLVKEIDLIIKNSKLKIQNSESEEDFLFFSPGKSYEMQEILGDLEGFRASLENPNVEKIGFHLKEKIVQFAKSGIEVRSDLFDFAVAEYLLNKETSYPSPSPQSSPSRGEEIGGGVGGGINTLQNYYEEKLKEKNLFSLFKEVEMPLINILAKLETKGVYIDIDYLFSLSKKFGEKLQDLEREVYLASGEEFNINSPIQLRKILFEKLGLPPGKRTKKGYSTDSEVLKGLSKIHHLPATLLEYRELYKLKSTYVDALPKLVSEEDNRLHTSFNQTGTSTGRLSSSNPNLQNIPIRTENGSLIRKAFKAEGKNFLFSFDYSQIELRILAHFSQDHLLRDAFLQGRDIHSETAALIFNRESAPSPSLFPSPLAGEGLGGGEEIGGGVKGEGRGGGITPEMRRIGKTVNFAIIYGMSGFGLAKELEIKRAEAEGFIARYFERYHRVKEYLNETLERARKDGYVSTILGRRRIIPNIKSKNLNLRKFAERAAVNMPIQGSAADLLKVAMVKIGKDLTKNNLRSKIILSIHDELLFEGPKNEGQLLTKIVKNDMLNAISLSVPLRVEVKKGKDWLGLTKEED